MIELAFAIGFIWAISRGYDHTRAAVKARTAAARKRTPDPHKRRAARQAAAGWWLGEIVHFFPHARHGWAAGWEEHRQAWREHQAAAAGRRADHAIRWAEIRAEIAAHARRIEVAAQREGAPSMSEQLRAVLRRLVQRLAGEQPAVQQDPPPDSTTPGNGAPAPANGHKAGHVRAPVAQHNGGNPMAGTGDINYTQVIETCDRAVATAEHAVSEADLAALTGMADQLGGMLRGDAETMGLAGDLAAAAAVVQATNKELIDAAAALKARTERAYGQYKEAADSSDAAPPEPEFVED
jgi:hypothetical protein